MIKTKSFELAVYQKGDENAEKLALILPGKLDSKDYAGMTSHVDMLADLGFFALSFDPPGTWESPGDISLYTMTNYLKAVDELIEYFGNKPTFIMGHSRGGSMSILASSRNPHITSYIAIMPGLGEATLTSLIQNTSMRDLPPGGGEKVKKFVLPDSFFEDEKKYRITDAVRNDKKPKLLIAGTQDILNPVGKVKETFDLLSEPKEFATIDYGHDYRLDAGKIEEVNEIIRSFLAKFDF
jgi:pimeloyl-ACP methyl ester carboxylesterase